MIEALQLLFSPFQTWERITTARPNLARVLLLYLVPFLLLGIGLETASLMHWGEKRGTIAYWSKVSEETAIQYAAVQILSIIGSIFIGAKILQWIAHSFQVRNTYAQTLTLMAYGFSPIILARYLDALPIFHTWLAWGVGALVALSVLYHGVALALRPEQTKGFGLYLVSVLLVLLSSGLTHFAAVSVLHGRFF